MSLHKRSQSSTRSSHGNLSQGSVTSADNHSIDGVEGTVQPCKAKIAERQSNGSLDMQGKSRFKMISFCYTKLNENNNDRFLNSFPPLPLFGQTDSPDPNSL